MDLMGSLCVPHKRELQCTLPNLFKSGVVPMLGNSGAGKCGLLLYQNTNLWTLFHVGSGGDEGQCHTQNQQGLTG